MASFNRVILMGNLTRDPQVRYIPSGTAVTDLGLAINRVWYDKDSRQKNEEVTFVDVTVWGRQAEIAGEYLSKGRSVLIEGYLKLDTWQDKETGQNRNKLKIVCENLTMVGGRNDGGGAPEGGGGGGYQQSSQSSAPPRESRSAPPVDNPADSFYDPPTGNSGGGDSDEEVPF